MTDLAPDEVEAGRQNLIAKLRSTTAGSHAMVEIHPQTVRELVAVLEALKPVVVDRAALREQIFGEVYNAGSPPMREWIDREDLYVITDAVLAALYPKATEAREEVGPHDPTGVLPTDAGVFVECACGKNPTPKYWIEDHWTGERSEGERRVRALLAEHLPAVRHPKATEGASDEHAVCNACGWDGSSTRITCPDCGSVDVNYFTPGVSSSGEGGK